MDSKIPFDLFLPLSPSSPSLSFPIFRLSLCLCLMSINYRLGRCHDQPLQLNISILNLNHLNLMQLRKHIVYLAFMVRWFLLCTSYSMIVLRSLFCYRICPIGVFSSFLTLITSAWLFRLSSLHPLLWRFMQPCYSYRILLLFHA